MNYPLWDVPYVGGGLLIAMVAVVHVYIAQFAVGGGLFLALGARKGYRSGDTEWLGYLRRHTRLFLLTSLVFGAITGVGIWFTIGLISPQATSVLIRTFVWGWAIEWCVFVVEISAILLFYYGWNRVDARTHQLIGWVYAGASYLTLVVINGIVSFMLTPGRWLETGSFWDGWLNPSYLPALVMRTAASLALAGLYGLLTATWQATGELRERLVGWTSRFLLVAFGLFPIGALWWMAVIPPEARALAFGGAAPIMIMFGMTVMLSGIIFVAAYFGPNRRPAGVSVTFAAVLLALGLLTTGGGEWVREGIRKPFVIYHYLYSNGVFVSSPPSVAGVLPAARWSVYGDVARAPSPEAAGADVFRIQCAACHTVDGYNGVAPLVRGWTPDFAAHQVDRLNMLKGYMPPFMGNAAERDALAAYLFSLNRNDATADGKEGAAYAAAKP